VRYARIYGAHVLGQSPARRAASRCKLLHAVGCHPERSAGPWL